MSEMVERVAKAIALADVGSDVWSETSEGHGSYGCLQKDDYRDMARAALKAMREPTAAMTIAGDESTGSSGLAIIHWEDMIDEALK